MEQKIINFLAELVVYGGGTVAIAYGLFMFLGKSWIENRFSERLEAYKHAQAKELENTRYRIDALFNRVSKIHEKEFEVLPEAWKALCESILATSRFVSIYKEYPHVDRMTEDQLEEFMENSFLHDFQKKELRNATNKFEYYKEALFYQERFEARSAMAKFHEYTEQNRIFLSKDLKDKFKEADQIIWEAYVNMEVGYESREFKMRREAWETVRDKIEPIKGSIEEMVQKRLNYHRAE